MELNLDKPQLIILSDLWGFRRAKYWNQHIQHYSQNFRLAFIDSTVIAEIPTALTSQKDIHTSFIDGGITKAVKNLNHQFPTVKYLIGHSIGGVIAWNYARENQIKELICISATRLRKETKKPECKTTLYYGVNDPYMPSSEWYTSMDIAPRMVVGDHSIYEDLFPTPSFK